ncbi:SecDF P1 head subdomain-containing protein [Umezawaea sp.]|uniref:SecDF P1 head subdomain-containing protein n=1 Tax=Umezawaea sp. TaxID=1955258 RepID=UPI002ED02B18
MSAPRRVDVRAFPSDTTLLLLLLTAVVSLNAVFTAFWLAGFDAGGVTVLGVVWKLEIVLVPGLAGWSLGIWWRLRRSVPVGGTPFTDAARLLDRLVREARLDDPPDVRLGPGLGSRAFVASGRGRPLLLLGPELLGLCTVSDEGRTVFTAVVRHELAHLRAGDVGWAQLGRLLRTSNLPIGFFVLFAVVLDLVHGNRSTGSSALAALVVLGQVLVVELVARAFLRAREHEADLLAARYGVEGLLTAVGDAPGVRPWLRRHPGGAARAAVLADPGRLLVAAPTRLLLGAAAAGSALVTLRGILGPADSTPVVTGAVVGLLVTLFTAFGIWRSTWLGGARPFRSAAALAVGLVLGSYLALFPAVFTFGAGAVPLRPSPLVALVLGAVLLCLWLAAVGRARYRVDPRARRVPGFLAYAVPAAALVGGWLFAVLWAWVVRLTSCADDPCSPTAVARSVGEDFAFGVTPVLVLVVVAVTALGPRVVEPRAAVPAAAAVVVAAVGLFGLWHWAGAGVSTLEIRAVVRDSTADPALDFDCATTAPAGPTEHRTACDVGGGERFVLGPAALTGVDVETAEVGFGGTGSAFVVEVVLTGEGANRWAALTGSAVDQRVAILVDGAVVSAPVVREPLRGTTFEISSGTMDRTSATELATRIAGG